MERENQEISNPVRNRFLSGANGVNEKIEMPENKKEQWAERAADLKERLRRILNREGITIQEKIAISEKMGSFKRNLLGRYGKDGVRESVLYHILAGSDGYEDIVKFLDFPDDDSIEKFIERLGEEQKEAEGGEENKE